MTDSNDQQPKKKKKGDILLTLVLIIAICVFCFAAYNLYHIYTEYKKGSDEYNEISQMAVTDRDPDELERPVLMHSRSHPSMLILTNFEASTKMWWDGSM